MGGRSVVCVGGRKECNVCTAECQGRLSLEKDCYWRKIVCATLNRLQKYSG